MDWFIRLNCLCAILSSLLSVILAEDSVGNLTLRIYGGTRAEKGEFPFQAGLRIPDEKEGYVSICGGTLIDAIHVLTAGHCLHGKDDAKIIGAPAYLDCIDTHDADCTKRTIQRYSIHPWFQRYPAPAHDLAIVTLDSPVDIIPAELPLSGSDALYVGEPAVVIGRGQTRGGNSSSISNALLKATVTIMSNEECAVQTKVESIPYEQVCAEAPGNSCKGDSGDPLLVNGVLQVGIVSYSGKPCDPAVAGVYARVSAYVDWILEVVSSDVVEPSVAPEEGILNPAEEILASITFT